MDVVASISRDRIEKLPEPKVIQDKSEIFDLEREYQAALSKLHYSIEANVAYELKKMRSLDKKQDVKKDEQAVVPALNLALKLMGFKLAD